MSYINRSDRIGLVSNLAVALFAIFVANVLIFATGALEAMPTLPLPLALPAGLVAIVWILIFLLWATARWTLLGAGDRGSDASWWIVALMVPALLFPITMRGDDPLASVTEGLLSLGMVLLVTWRISVVSSRSAVLMFPSVVWLLFVNVLGVLAYLQLTSAV
jgi:tryptophan-rich sensory protein